MAAAQCLVPKSVATNIKSDEPIALFTHFYGQSINLGNTPVESMKHRGLDTDTFRPTLKPLTIGQCL